MPAAGLCDSCAHQRVIRNTRGSSFSLCERSRADPAYAKYPRLPVRECPGWEPRGGVARRAAAGVEGAAPPAVARVGQGAAGGKDAR